MANWCQVMITVLGSIPENFRETLGRAIYKEKFDDGFPYPEGPFPQWRRDTTISATQFYLETKWEDPGNEIAELSKSFPDLKFHLQTWLQQDGPYKELLIVNDELVAEVYATRHIRSVGHDPLLWLETPTERQSRLERVAATTTRSNERVKCSWPMTLHEQFPEDEGIELSTPEN